VTQTNYGRLVETADQKRERVLEKAFRDHLGGHALEIWANALSMVNSHITVDGDVFNEAADEYTELAQHLVDKLKWPEDAISVSPQGSTNTKTLIRSPTRQKFDIDAVCTVDLNRVEAQNPMKFFEEIGQALEDYNAEDKPRCWRVHYTNRPFYIDFTPAVPLSTISPAMRAHVRYAPTAKYQATALAVVDCPTETWKTSNPEGFAQWVNDQASRTVLRIALEEEVLAKRADIAPVPVQEVPLTDTLRVAIRLFKRHRDMAVKRGLLNSDYAPISVIIVTLLTSCYEGMADRHQSYTHPIELLLALAEYIPHLIEIREGKYWIPNPTVDGENFAEKWNDDYDMRFKEFRKWCGLLVNDLVTILAATDADTVRERVQTVFGCTGADTGNANLRPLGLLAVKKPENVPAARPGKGLA
jgi:hypothetical protein